MVMLSTNRCVKAWTVLVCSLSGANFFWPEFVYKSLFYHYGILGLYYRSYFLCLVALWCAQVMIAAMMRLTGLAGLAHVFISILITYENHQIPSRMIMPSDLECMDHFSRLSLMLGSLEYNYHILVTIMTLKCFIAKGHLRARSAFWNSSHGLDDGSGIIYISPQIINYW